MVMVPGKLTDCKTVTFNKKRRYGITIKIPKKVRFFSPESKIFRFVAWHEKDYHFPTRDEVVIFVAGHEFGHYLMLTGQVDKLNSETNADKIGYQWVRSFNSRKRIKEMIRIREMLSRNRRRRLIFV